MTQPFFSVVIPVYNAERFLCATLDSVLAQSFSDYEIVAVNDGSTDSSLSILQEYAKKNPQINIISTENQKAFLSRTIGFENAKGKYIVSVDADDTCTKDELQTLYNLLQRSTNKNNTPDVLIFDNNLIDEKSIHIKLKHNRKNNFYDLSDITKNFPNSTSTTKEFLKKLIISNTYNNIWSKVFKRELLDINACKKYPAFTMGDDVVFTFKILKNAVLVQETESILYNYRIVNTGATRRNFKTTNNYPVLLYNSIKSFIQERNLSLEDFSNLLATRLLKDCAVAYLLAPNKITKKETDIYTNDILQIADNEIFISVCNDFLKSQSFIIKYINSLILKKKINKLIFYKKILQISFVNKILRKLFFK